MRLLLVVVAGCLISAGAYSAIPIKPTWSRTMVTIVWHRVSPERIQQVCGARALGYRVGCAKIRTDPNRICHVYAPLPRHLYDDKRWAILGHEIGHCFLGMYHHDHQLKKNPK